LRFNSSLIICPPSLCTATMKTVGFALVALSSVAHGALTGKHKSDSGRGLAAQQAPEPEPKRRLQDMASMMAAQCSRMATTYQGMPASSDWICAMTAPSAGASYASIFSTCTSLNSAVFNGVTTCSAFGAAYATYCGQIAACLKPTAAPTTKAPWPSPCRRSMQFPLCPSIPMQHAALQLKALSLSNPAETCPHAARFLCQRLAKRTELPMQRSYVRRQVVQI